MSTSVLETDKPPVLEDVRDVNLLSLSLGEVNQSSHHLGRADDVSPVLENTKKISPILDINQLSSVLEDVNTGSPVLEFLNNVSPVLEWANKVSLVLEGVNNVSPVLEGVNNVSTVLEGVNNVSPVLENMSQSYPSLEDVTQVLPILESKKMDSQYFKVASDKAHYRYVKLFDNNKREFMQNMIRIHELVKGSGKQNYEGLRIPVYSGINCKFLSQELEGYDNIGIVQLMRYGAPINHVSGAVKFSRSDHRSHSGARLFPDEIDRYITKERRYKSVLGPFDVTI